MAPRDEPGTSGPAAGREKQMKALLHILGLCLVGYVAVAWCIALVVATVIMLVVWPVVWALTPGYRASKMLW
jgi:Flp pilus assembly protein TadB